MISAPAQRQHIEGALKDLVGIYPYNDVYVLT